MRSAINIAMGDILRVVCSVTNPAYLKPPKDLRPERRNFAAAPADASLGAAPDLSVGIEVSACRTKA